MNEDLLALTTDIVAAHVSNNAVSTAELPDLIRATYAALAKTGEAAPVTDTPQEPAVSIRASIKPDHLVCLEDGKKLTMLKRYLRTNYDMSPADYRAKWKLPHDYPMVAPAYAERRRTLAMSFGLGRKAKDAAHAIEVSTLAAVHAAEDAVEAIAEPVVAAVIAGRKRLGIAAAKAAAAAHLGGGKVAVEASTEAPGKASAKASQSRATKAN